MVVVVLVPDDIVLVVVLVDIDAQLQVKLLEEELVQKLHQFYLLLTIQ